jgi:hypothetical protein
MLPNLIIIGAMRSGTSALARYLGAHPEVFMARVKEVRFFDRYYDRGVDWYEQHFAGARAEKVVGEATPNYMYEECAIARMAQVVPKARLIAILRNPVDRAYSHYWHRRALGRETRTFEEIVAAATTGGPGGGAGSQPHQWYLDRSRYLPQLLRVCRFYPREALLVSLFEDLRDAPGPTYAAICRFLEIDDAFVPLSLGRQINRFVAWRSVRLREWSRGIPGPLARVLARLLVKKEDYPPMDRAMRARLQAYFAEGNAALAAWLGRDLSGWAS